MPRYYFHVQNDTSFTPDEEGVELLNLTAACAEARKTLGDIVGEEIASGKSPVHLTIMIDDHERTRAANINAVANVVSTISPFSD